MKYPGEVEDPYQKVLHWDHPYVGTILRLQVADGKREVHTTIVDVPTDRKLDEKECRRIIRMVKLLLQKLKE